MSEHIDLETVFKLCRYWTDESYTSTPGGPTPEERLVGKAVLIMFPVVRAAFEAQMRAARLRGGINQTGTRWTEEIDLRHKEWLEATDKCDNEVKKMLDSLATGELPSTT